MGGLRERKGFEVDRVHGGQGEGNEGSKDFQRKIYVRGIGIA